MGNGSRLQLGFSSREEAHKTIGHGTRFQKYRGLWVTEPSLGPKGLWVIYHPPIQIPTLPISPTGSHRVGPPGPSYSPDSFSSPSDTPKLPCKFL